jgi:hypothetical protein
MRGINIVAQAHMEFLSLMRLMLDRESMDDLDEEDDECLHLEALDNEDAEDDSLFRGSQDEDVDLDDPEWARGKPTGVSFDVWVLGVEGEPGTLIKEEE